MGLACTILATSCESILISKQKVQINPKIMVAFQAISGLHASSSHLLTPNLAPLFPELYLSVWLVSWVLFSTAFNCPCQITGALCFSNQNYIGGLLKHSFQGPTLNILIQEDWEVPISDISNKFSRDADGDCT